MAIAIHTSPELTGESAELFVKEAENRPVTLGKLTKKEEDLLERVKRMSIEFKEKYSESVESGFNIDEHCSFMTKLVTRYSLNRINRHINNHKRGRTYPAVLIGRIGVDKDFRGKGYHIGTQLLDFLKAWFRSEDNKTGCRFLLVDAYNSSSVLPFYEKCGFNFLYKTEHEEKEFYGIDADEPLRTRMMYCDLK